MTGLDCTSRGRIKGARCATRVRGQCESWTVYCMDRTIVHRVGGSKERAAVYSTRVPYQSIV